MPTCLTLEHKLDAVVVRHAHYKVDLQCGQGRVFTLYFKWGHMPALPPSMWLEWSDLNASSMCSDAFTPVFTAAHLWSYYQSLSCQVWTVPCRWRDHACDSVRGVGMRPQPYMGGPLKGGKRGIKQGAPLGGEGIGVMSVWHSNSF